MNKKRLCKIVLLFVIIFAFCLLGMRVSADSSDDVDYSDNYYLVISESDIDFSQYNQVYINSLINEVFNALDNDINAEFAYNFSLSQELAYQIKDFYYRYYSIDGIKNNKESKSSDYILQYSSIQNSNGEWNHSSGVWNNRYFGYNCYAFSINRYEEDYYYSPNANYHYQPSEFSDEYSVSDLNAIIFDVLDIFHSIWDLADIVEDDLKSIGYYNISTSSTPNYNLSSNQRMICVRKGSTDYHFMKYDAITEAWYHKPGPAAIMKYDSYPSNNISWSNECFYVNSLRSPDTYYTSNIIYITYYVNNINMSCHTTETNLTKNIFATKDCLIETNVHCDRNYSFVFSASNSFEVHMYDDNMDILFNYISEFNNNNSRFEIAYVDYLFSGKYYFRINYLSNSSTGDITLTYKSVTNHYGALHVNYDYDVMTHLHFDGESLCNNLSFNNSYGPSFYKFILDVDTDDEDFYYLENQFCIKDTNGNIIDKYYFDSTYNKEAINDDLQNEMVMFIPSSGTYYIDIVLPDIDYNSIYFTYTNIDYSSIDFYDNAFDIEFSRRLIDFETDYDYVNKIEIEQYGTYDLDVRVSGSIGYNLTVFLCNITNNGLNEIYVDDIIGSHSISTYSNIVLSPGIYYFGYFNNEANVAVNGRLFRVLSNDNPNMLTAMMCDPDSSYPYGSEVRFNNGSFNNNTITIGFTRFIGFDDLYGVGSLYNVDYDFYASNNKISVSSYGTILAESAGSATVYAIYRNDPSKVYVLNVTIINDNGNNRSIYSSITHYYDYSSSISTYQFELYDEDCPYPAIMDYSWTISTNNINATMSIYGTISVSGPGTITLIGSYYRNPKITVYITVIFE